MEKSADDMWSSIVTDRIYVSSTLSCLCRFVVCCAPFPHLFEDLKHLCNSNGLSSGMNVVLQPPLVLKCIPLTSLQTVVAFVFTAGTQLAKRSLEVFVMVTSKSIPLSEAFSAVLIFVKASVVIRAHIWNFFFDCSLLCCCDAAYMDSVPLSCLM